MIKVNLLEARMKEKELKYDDLAKYLGMSYQSLHKRVKGKVDFRLNEIVHIKKFLNLGNEQIDIIFFQEN